MAKKIIMELNNFGLLNKTCKYLHEINPASVTFVKSLFVLFVKTYNFEIQFEEMLNGVFPKLKGNSLTLKPRDVARSLKQGYQWSHKKDLCPPKLLKKEEINWIHGIW